MTVQTRPDRPSGESSPDALASAGEPLIPAPGIYTGQVMHKRLKPFGHRFDYRVFSVLVDIDAPAGPRGRIGPFSHNRFNWLSFHDADHGPRDGSPLRPWIDDLLNRFGLPAGGPVRLMSFPRVLGYVFNPLSLYFCYHPDGRLLAILYEVRNTFGDMHGYLVPVDAGWDGAGPVIQACDKQFYVSPFIEMTSHYRFRVTPPGERFAILIRQATTVGETLIATQTGKRAPLTAAGLWRAFRTLPMVTWKVIVAIHWQALKLWAKGARFYGNPGRPVTDVERPDSGTETTGRALWRHLGVAERR